MKIAVIGGAGVRTPLLVSGLSGSDLPIDEIALYDTDQPRLSVIGAVAGRAASRGRIVLSASATECVAGADFVFTSIRAGGIERRVHDEAVAQHHGIAGQETVGPAGFAMAMRTIPVMVRYTREIARVAPAAWIVNFTNPVGMVTEAMRAVSGRVIGICDTPTELFEDTARALGLQSAACDFDYFGLNHLGWLREVYAGGEPQLHRLWHDPQRLQAVYKTPLFDAAWLQSLELLPTEYVYYYVHGERAFDNLRRARRTRGEVIADLTRGLFAELDRPGADVLPIYHAYLAARSAGYMQIEAGASRPRPQAIAEMSGYDKIALSVVAAIHRNANAIIPLSVRNAGTIPDLLDDDVVEVPCIVNANGARPLHAGRLPAQVRGLVERVKHYERRTVAAAMRPSIDAACEALAANPLVADLDRAARLVADLSPLW